MPGIVAWFTGLSGAGKTTISDRAAELLREAGRTVEVLDGDVVRANHAKKLGFSPEDIRENNRLIAEMCKRSAADNDLVLVPIISPFRDSRRAAKQALGNCFREIYVYVSLDEAKRRDPKGLYQKAMSGTLDGLIGIGEDVPYEPPESADITLDTESNDPEECAVKLAGFLAQAGGGQSSQ